MGSKLKNNKELRFVGTRSPSKAPHGAGIVILDRALESVYANPAALQVLSFPQLPANVLSLSAQIAARLSSAGIFPFLEGRAPSPRWLVSGRRRYVCRFFPLGPPSNGSPPTAVAVVLERNPRGAVDVAQIAAEYDLTEREGETVGYLVEGLTSKEIAQRMGISPNTVKVFLRLAMIKMGVTTRSGILGTLVKRRDEASIAQLPNA